MFLCCDCGKVHVLLFLCCSACYFRLLLCVDFLGVLGGLKIFRSLRSVSLFVSICSIIEVRSSLFLFPGGLKRSICWITDDDDQALAYFKQTVNQTGLREQDLAFALAEFHTGNGAKRNLDHAIDNLSKLHQI